MLGYDIWWFLWKPCTICALAHKSIECLTTDAHRPIEIPRNKKHLRTLWINLSEGSFWLWNREPIQSSNSYAFVWCDATFKRKRKKCAHRNTQPKNVLPAHCNMTPSANDPVHWIEIVHLCCFENSLWVSWKCTFFVHDRNTAWFTVVWNKEIWLPLVAKLQP